jgi:hypothetical protein
MTAMSAYDANAVCWDSPDGTRFYLDAAHGWTTYAFNATKFNDHIAAILCKELDGPRHPEIWWMKPVPVCSYTKPFPVCFYTLDT